MKITNITKYIGKDIMWMECDVDGKHLVTNGSEISEDWSRLEQELKNTLKLIKIKGVKTNKEIQKEKRCNIDAEELPEWDAVEIMTKHETIEEAKKRKYS